MPKIWVTTKREKGGLFRTKIKSRVYVNLKAQEYVGGCANDHLNIRVTNKTNRKVLHMRWTKEETEYLEEWYGIKSPQEMSEHLGKSKGAIRQQANRVGITSMVRWTEEEDKYLEKWYGTRSIESISNYLGRTVHAVYNRADRLYLGKITEYTDAITMEEVSRMMGVRADIVRKHWIKQGLKHRRCGKYVMIKHKHLIEWMQDNPELYEASNCERFHFDNYKWFHDKLLAERERRCNERWGIAN